MTRTSAVLFAAIASLFSAALAAAPTSPKTYFGFDIGDDYRLATFTQAEEYFKKLAEESPRVKYVDIGPTEEGRRQCMLVVTSPANHAKLERYRSIARKLGRADGVSEREARALAAEGKAVVWIDGGLHSRETAGFMQLIETAWQLSSRSDAETQRILDNTIVLLVHANPDGHELMSTWYLRHSDPKKRSLDDPPRLYQKYIGHDNNRDFFMLNMKESVNLSRQLYIEWLPQIMYNHHQTAPVGTVIAIPPYRGPFNYVYDPLIISGLDAVGSALYNRFNAEGKPGAVRQDGAVFSTWWNGGLRTTAYYHNIIGILTEIIGDPTPIAIPVTPDRLLPSMALPNPILPQLWHYRRTIDYSLSANYAILDYAARYRDELLYNIYRMGRNAIDRGSADHWTSYPNRVQAVRTAYDEERKERKSAASGGTAAEKNSVATEEKSAQVSSQEDAQFLAQHFNKPEWRDPRAYVVPANQPDFPTAVKFINALVNSGIRVHRATRDFSAGGKTYPAGSFVVRTAQAFRAHVIDSFEPQDHPNDVKYEGGPPVPPYDSAGWTLAFEMGVQFDRFLDPLDGPFAEIPYGQLQAPPKASAVSGASVGWLLSPRQNDSFRAVNALLASGADVYRLPDGVAGDATFGPGTFFVAANRDPRSAGGANRAAAPISARSIVEDRLTRLGLTATAASADPGTKVKLAPARIALLDVYGGSMTSGWTRWIFEQYEWPFEVIYPPQIDAGILSRFDVLVLTDSNPFAKPDDSEKPRIAESDIPEPYRARFGRLTPEKSLPQIKAFLDRGGRLVAFGANAALASTLDLPVQNALTDLGREGKARPLSKEKFYIPGSVLQAQVDPSLPAAWGMPATVDLYFAHDSAFNLSPQSTAAGLKPIVWYGPGQALRSGWGQGQNYLQNTVAGFEVPVGRGRVFFYAPNINFRGQTHGVFKLLFNVLYGDSGA